MKKLSIVLLVIVCSYNCYSKDIPDLIPFRKNEKFGYCDRNLNILIKIQFDDARPFYNNSKAIVKLNGSFFFINTKGERVSDLYEAIEDQKDNSIARAKKNGLWCLLNHNCIEIISPSYLYIREFHRGAAWSVDSCSRKWILISETGKALSSLYDYINDFYYKKTIVGVYKDGKTDYEILKHNGHIFQCLKNKYEFIDGFSDGLAIVRRDSAYGYLRRNGKIKIDINFKNALSFSEGIAIVVNCNGDTQALTKKGKVLYSIRYSVCYDATFRCKRLPVLKDNKIGVIDEKQNLILDFQYDAIIISNGVIAVKSDDKWCFLDINCRPITELLFDENMEANYWVSYDVGYEFKAGLARTIYSGRPTYIDIHGTLYCQD